MQILCFGYLLLATAALAVAQSVTGTIVGLITDSSGASVPGATIKLVNLRTGFERSFKTKNDGEYTLSALLPGEYSMQVTADGFRTESIGLIPLAVSQTARVNLLLSPGGVGESVRVEAVVPLLNTDTAALGQVINTQRILELPLNGRQFLELALLVPGVNGGNGGPQSGTQSLFQRPGQNSSLSVSGGRAQNNNFLLDGTTNTDGDVNTYVVSPSVDAIQEFKVETGNYSAEFGRSSSGQISVITKSGTNERHGSVYEFLRNNAMDARPFKRTYAQELSRDSPSE